MNRDHIAFDRVHPDFIDLMARHDINPPVNPPSEDAMARSILLAIQMEDEPEQAGLVSRIIHEDELAAQRLRGPDFRNLDHSITLDEAERLVALRGTPDPERRIERRAEDVGECIICGERGHVRVPCDCAYCFSCLREGIRRRLTSLNEFPPRCCVHFTEETIRLVQRPELVHLFRQLEEENGVPVRERVYCHDRQCAAFIPPGCDGECLICEKRTCRHCGAEAHGNRECEEGDIVEDVWEMMDRDRIVNCPGCGIMVQLAEACNHMLCTTCGTEFCLICGRGDWRACGCPTYGGHRHMVPMRRRPGLKPERYRRAPRRRAEAAPAEPGLKIPQLRTRPGDVGPRVREVRRRTRRLDRPEPVRPPRGQREPERQERARDAGGHMFFEEEEDDGHFPRPMMGARRPFPVFGAPIPMPMRNAPHPEPLDQPQPQREPFNGRWRHQVRDRPPQPERGGGRDQDLAMRFQQVEDVLNEPAVEQGGYPPLDEQRHGRPLVFPNVSGYFDVTHLGPLPVYPAWNYRTAQIAAARRAVIRDLTASRINEDTSIMAMLTGDLNIMVMLTRDIRTKTMAIKDTSSKVITLIDFIIMAMFTRATTTTTTTMVMSTSIKAMSTAIITT
ncbi:hypothetical protein ACHAPT_000558 [Fusarium lateritium]